MAKQFGPSESPEEFDEGDYRPKRHKVKITKPSYADFKETRENRSQLTCECGSQHWHLWDDQVASCAICGLPEPIISFSIRDGESAEDFLDAVMSA
jgi:hypothetical protein